MGGGNTTAAAHRESPDDVPATVAPTAPSTTLPETVTTSTSTPPTAAPDTVTETSPPTTTTSPATATAPAGTSTTTTTSSPLLETGDVEGFEIITARLGERSLLLALADTNSLRSRGLMGVLSLGDLDGMVFAWKDPVGVSFWMKNTLIPLDIGYFDEDGALFAVLAMVPCTQDPCPTYPSATAVRFALEAVPGFFDEVPLGESLILGETVAWP
ncbi:MAG: DUF192 domain-containing protein [Actinomycetia bacterium]|nr:DUF192 domain-containing protein [Actinomycetes bacterium]